MEGAQAVRTQARELRFSHTRRNQTRELGSFAFEESRVGFPLESHPCMLAHYAQAVQAQTGEMGICAFEKSRAGPFGAILG